MSRGRVWVRLFAFLFFFFLSFLFKHQSCLRQETKVIKHEGADFPWRVLHELGYFLYSWRQHIFCYFSRFGVRIKKGWRTQTKCKGESTFTPTAQTYHLKFLLIIFSSPLDSRTKPKCCTKNTNFITRPANCNSLTFSWTAEIKSFLEG